MKSSLIKGVAAAAFGLACAGAQAGVIAMEGTYGEFDRSSGSRVFTIGQHGRVTDVNLTIDFSKCPDPEIGPNGTSCTGTGLAFPNEIELKLQGSNGVVVDLVNLGTYRTGAGRVTVTFDDEAAGTVGGTLLGGTFRPVGSLAAFDGIDMFGTWSLLVRDAGAGDPLEYFWSRLDIASESVAVPEPATLGILGIGMLGMLAARRRKPA